MSSKEDILASIRKNTKNRYEYPDWQINATVYPDVVAKFCEMSFAVGGEAIVLREKISMLSFAVLTLMPAALLPIWRKSRVLRSILIC
mgnify:CR=1 FL=1